MYHHIVVSAKKQLDPWTVYELEKETQKLQCHTNPRKNGEHSINEVPKIPTKRRSSKKNYSSTSNQPSSLAKKKMSNTSNNTRSNNKPKSRKSTVIPRHHANEGIHQMIETAKSKRKSLLLEVKIRSLYQERRSSRNSRSFLGDSIASLPDVLEEGVAFCLETMTTTTMTTTSIGAASFELN